MSYAMREEIIREKILPERSAARALKPELRPAQKQTRKQIQKLAQLALAPSQGLSRVALVASFPPRRCGIAAFASDVHAQLAALPGFICDVVAVSDGLETTQHEAVRHVIRQDAPEDYVAAAEALNAEAVQLVCVQHEFGIFGGDAGDYLLRFLDALDCPVVVTLHTVLQDPNADQRRVVTALLQRAARLVVMAERGRRMLIEIYGADPDKVVVIPHGAPDCPLIDPDSVKPRFGLEGREVLLTFGLLSPGKGIESVIRALPGVVATRPNVTYVVLGATHPHLMRRDGEAYRESLMQLAADLGVGAHVRFVNAYLETDELLAYLAAADVYVTPYLNAAQITSGTLSYAVALGKPVVSTPYWHAEELLSDGVGVLVDFNDSAAIGAALIALLQDEKRRAGYRARAYAKGRETIWTRAGARYLETFNAAARPAQKQRRRVPAETPSFLAVERLSDACGILQHGKFCLHDRAHGYCLDDNARALILTLRAGRRSETERLVTTYASFVNHAWNQDRRRFRNFMSYDRRWLEEEGSQDSCARGLWALGETARLAGDADLRAWALDLGARATRSVRDFTHLRSHALSVLGLCGLARADAKNDEVWTALEASAGVLAQALRRAARPGWIWFEPSLSYDNARLPEALIRAGDALGEETLTAAGLKALIWLAEIQIGPGDVFRPVGNESFGAQYVTPALHDQQPIEAAAMIDACWAAFDATGDASWEDEAHRAYAWFFGANTTDTPLVALHGGCYDGLSANGVNRNQGAESVLALQLAHCAMKARERGQARLSR